MAGIKQTNSLFRKSCAIGLLLSCYALFVEVKKEVDEDYTAFCDISEHVSCTKAFSSKYGKGFGIIGSILGKDSHLNQPNSLAGIVFYALLLVLSFSDQKSIVKLQLSFCVISNFMSLYLAYILYFILHNFCLVCVGTYIVNVVNLALCMSKWNLLKTQRTSEVSSHQKHRKE